MRKTRKNELRKIDSDIQGILRAIRNVDDRLGTVTKTWDSEKQQKLRATHRNLEVALEHFNNFEFDEAFTTIHKITQKERT